MRPNKRSSYQGDQFTNALVLVSYRRKAIGGSGFSYRFHYSYQQCRRLTQETNVYQ